MELNHHSSRGAFTAPWARHCPAYPCQESSGLGTVIREGVLSSDDCPLNWRKVKESNPRPKGRPGFRGRLRTTAHHLPMTGISNQSSSNQNGSVTILITER